MDAMIPIVAISTPFLTAAVIVIIIVAASHRKDIAKFNLVEKALQSNSSPEVVEQLVRSISEESRKQDTPPRQRHLTHATVFLALGISFFALRFIIGGTDVVGLLASAAVLTMLGLAKLVIAFFIVGKPSEKQ